MKKKLNLIVASTKNLGIGKNQDLPWPRLAKDMKFFRKMTTRTKTKENQNAIIMGANTFESIKKTCLPGRVNVVLTSRKSHFERNLLNPDELNKNLFFCENIDDAIILSQSMDNIEERFIIGGAKVYNSVLEDIDAFSLDKLFWTRVYQDFECDTFLNKKLFDHVSKQFKHKWVSKTHVQNKKINFDFVQMSREKEKIDR